MERVKRELSYLGRLVAGKLREWGQLFALGREVSSLLNRRDELMMRLGTRYHQFLLETQSEPPPAVAETVHDLRAVSQRMTALDATKRRIREETASYINRGLTFEMGERPTRKPPLPRRAPEGHPHAAPRSLPVAGREELELPEEMLGRRAARGEPEGDRCECGEVFPPGANFCPACGRPREGKPVEVSPDIAPPRDCPHCGTRLSLGAEFCPKCGGHIDAEVFEV